MSSRTYNQQNPDGSWSQVTATTGANGQTTYASTPIAPSGYAAAGIPTPSNGTQMGGSDAAATIQEKAVYDQAMIAYNNARLQNYDMPMAEVEKDRLAYQAAEAAATQAANLIKTYGDQGLQALQQAGNLGMNVADMMAKLQGPSNAFAYDRAITGLRNNGLGGSVSALTGGAAPAQFGAMGPTSPMTLQTMGQQLGGGSGAPQFGGSGIVGMMLGMAGQADQGYLNAGQGKLPFAIPQFNPQNISGTQSGQIGTTDTANMTGQTNGFTAPGGTFAGGSNTLGGFSAPTAGRDAYNAFGYSGQGRPATPGTVSGFASGGNAMGGFSAPKSMAPGGMQAPLLGGAGGGSFMSQYSPTAQAYLRGLPNPSQVNARNFFALPKYSQDLAMSGYSALGYDPSQLGDQFKAMLPQKSAGPSFGLVG